MANETRNNYMNRKVRISPTGVLGGVARMTWKIGKLELQNFILTKNSKLYESMHQRKFLAIRYYTGYEYYYHLLQNRSGMA